MEFSNTKMVFLLAAVAAAGFMATALVGGLHPGIAANAQQSSMLPPGANYPHNLNSTISTTGTALQNVKPDRVSVTLGVESNGTTASEAVAKNSGAMDKVISALRGLGIQESELATSSFSVYPIYEYVQPMKPCIDIYPTPPECMPKQTIIGYGASNSVTVTLDVNSTRFDAGEAIDAAVGAGANNVNSAYFFILNDLQEEIRNSLIREAIGTAKNRAELAADAVGYTVSGVQSINLNDVYFPVYYAKAGAEGDFGVQSTALLPGVQQVSTTVNIIFYMSDITAAQ